MRWTATLGTPALRAAAVWAAALWTAAPSTSLAAPNAQGVLVVHCAPSLQESSSAAMPAPGELPGSCGLLAPTAPAHLRDVLWYVLAVFPESTDVRVAGLGFGLGDYDPDALRITEYGVCGGSRYFELAGERWPAPGSSTAISFTGAPLVDRIAPVYWFRTEVSAPGTIVLRGHPSGASFADDSAPSQMAPIAGFGRIGFGGIPGANLCVPAHARVGGETDDTAFFCLSASNDPAKIDPRQTSRLVLGDLRRVHVFLFARDVSRVRAAADAVALRGCASPERIGVTGLTLPWNRAALVTRASERGDPIELAWTSMFEPFLCYTWDVAECAAEAVLRLEPREGRVIGGEDAWSAPPIDPSGGVHQWPVAGAPRDRLFFRVVDTQGRTVAQLESALDAHGRGSLQWDGLDASGAPLPATTYFVYARSLADPKETVKLITLR